MKESLIKQEFERIEKYIFDKSNWQNMIMTRAWAKSQPSEAGVYMLFEKGKTVYVGESGSISGRITDMLDFRHHTVRRAMGEKWFSHIEGYNLNQSIQSILRYLFKRSWSLLCFVSCQLK